MKEKDIRVVQAPGILAVETIIVNELKTFQTIVKGYIEVVHIPTLNEDGILVICNEEGKLKQLEPNISCYELDDILVGNLVALSCDNDGNFTSLTNDQITKAIKYFNANAI